MIIPSHSSASAETLLHVSNAGAIPSTAMMSGAGRVKLKATQQSPMMAFRVCK